jgi:hypothetical protein
MGVSLKLEEWQSSHNRRERHYFLQDGRQHGYQEGRYLLGLNPQIVPADVEQAILALLEPIISGLR